MVPEEPLMNNFKKTDTQFMGIHSPVLNHKKDFKEYFVELLMLFIAGKINQLDRLSPYSFPQSPEKTDNKQTGKKNKSIRLNKGKKVISQLEKNADKNKG
jgi:hypothetical protein